jgi:Ser/Thr protein kinase RdoA (MazF antagonist)
MPEIPPELAARWRLGRAVHLGTRLSSTWRAEREPGQVVVKRVGDQALPDWPYELEFMESMRRAGWPVPELVAEPEVRLDGVWLLLSWLPGQQADGTGSVGSALARGRLLAEFHAAAEATGITRRRIGFPTLSGVVADSELQTWLAVHEQRVPEEGALLRECRQAVLERFAGCELTAAPMCVIHGDFAPWNLLFDDGRLSGVLDFEGCHYNLKVADFALAWRGGHDDVLRGYDAVRPLSELEWRLVLPAYWAWLFLGVKDLLARTYGSTRDPRPVHLGWQVRQLRRRSALLIARFGEGYTYGGLNETRSERGGSGLFEHPGRRYTASKSGGVMVWIGGPRGRVVIAVAVLVIIAPMIATH